MFNAKLALSGGSRLNERPSVPDNEYSESNSGLKMFGQSSSQSNFNQKNRPLTATIS